MSKVTVSQAMRADAPPLAGQQRFVALMDILGFREIIDRNDLSVVVDRMRYVHMMVDAAAGLSTMYPREDRKSRCRHSVYSDSVLIYTEGTELEDFDAILLAANQALALSMMLGVLMRGAVVKGDLYVGPNQHIIVGSALTRAYAIEQGQQWAGAILDASNLNDTERRYLDAIGVPQGWLMPYDVPWESRDGVASTRAALAIGWPMWFPRRDFALVDEMARDLLPQPDARALSKQQATLAFLEAHRSKYTKKPWPNRAQMTPEERQHLQRMEAQIAAKLAELEVALKKSGLTLGQFVERGHLGREDGSS